VRQTLITDAEPVDPPPLFLFSLTLAPPPSGSFLPFPMRPHLIYIDRWKTVCYRLIPLHLFSHALVAKRSQFRHEAQTPFLVMRTASSETSPRHHVSERVLPRTPHSQTPLTSAPLIHANCSHSLMHNSHPHPVDPCRPVHPPVLGHNNGPLALLSKKPILSMCKWSNLIQPPMNRLAPSRSVQPA